MYYLAFYNINYYITIYFSADKDWLSGGSLTQ